jgi:CDP-6-deoxy-D-xylo-4-hexulose-3-dehydrase
MKEYRIPLMKKTFYNDEETKHKLSEFIIKTDKFSMGEQCLKFENKLKSYFDSKHATFVNSGSSANLALLQSLINLKKLKPGDTVGFSGITWPTNVMPIMQLGLVPYPIDIDNGNLNIDLESVRSIISKKIKLKCIFVTNLLGISSDLFELQAICEDEGIILIEDNCESLGSEIGNKKLGTFGIASTHSTFVGHHLSTIEGGFVITDLEELDNMLKMVRAHGWNRSLSEKSKIKLREKWKVSEFYDLYTFYELAYNLRPTEINGFLGNSQIDFLPEMVERRQENHKKFGQALSHKFRTAETKHMSTLSSFAFSIIANTNSDFDLLKNTLYDAEIEFRPIVGGSINLQPFFRNTSDFDLKVAQTVHQFGLYIPNRPDLKMEEVTYIQQILSIL